MTVTQIHGLNAGYVMELYDKFLASPDSFDENTREFFQNWTPLTDDMTTLPAEMVADVYKVKALGNYVQAIRQFGHVGAQVDPLGTAPIGDPELAPDYHGLNEADLHHLPAGLID
ncbi:MAG: 2-oxoglutarate dehydrogenase E1 component, partial [Anaerolineae bacterium]|nr:2-oxoglutarate dehydrogenase E1 component [Anaerolineae bacterium]